MERKEWTKEDLEKLKDLLSKGYTYKEAASALGRSYDSIRGIVKRLRIKGCPFFSESPRFGATPRRVIKSKSKGLLELSSEEVKSLLNKGSSEKYPKDVGEKEVEEMDKIDISRILAKAGREHQRSYSSSWVLSDSEVAGIIERYLKRTKNIEGARNLWKLHIQYKRKYLGRG